MADESPNPLGSLPNQPSLPNLPPPPAVAPQSPPPPVPQPNPAQVAQAADDQHHSLLGRTFRSLMGNEVNYQVDPQTGKLVQTQTEQKPGSLWRGMLAGVLLGGATASKNHATDFAGGMAQGAEGVVQDKQRQDLVKREQARQQFEDSLKAQQNQRAEKRAATEDTLMQAQIQMHNAHTLHENKLMQREDYDFHEKVAENGRKQLQPFVDAGLPYKFKDMPESQMNDLLKQNPDAGKFLWEPTGTRIILGADGKPNVEATYSAVDPKGKIKVTDDQLKAWKEVGMDQFYGKSFFDALKKDKELDASQYMALIQKEQELTNKKLIRSKQQLELDKDKGQIALSKAQVGHLNAETYKIYQDEKDKKLLDEAFSIMSSGGDLSKLSAKQRALLSKGVTEVMGTVQRQLHELPKGPDGQTPTDQDRAKELYRDWDGYEKVLNKLYGIKTDVPAGSVPANPVSEKQTNFLELMQSKGTKPGTPESYTYIQEANISPTEKLNMVKAAKAPLPYDTVSAMAAEENMTTEKKIKQLRSQGFVVGESPWRKMVSNPEVLNK